jgi:ATP-dependent Lhr-like helicase
VVNLPRNQMVKPSEFSTYYIQFTMNVSEQDFYRIVQEEIEKEIDPMTLLYPKEAPVFDKYDDILPEELTRKGFANGVLNLEEMKQRVIGWME